MMVLDFSSLPSALTIGVQFTLWRDEEGRKVPYQCNGHKASINAPSTWCTFQRAEKTLVNGRTADGQPFTGIKRAFTDNDFCTGIDLDDSLDEAGQLLPWAQEIFGRVPSYAEVSPSGRGIKIFVGGRLDGDGKKRGGKNRKYGTGGAEIYDRSHFFTLTGRRYGDAPAAVVKHQDALIELYDELFPPAAIERPAVVASRPTMRDDIRKVRCRGYLITLPNSIDGSGGSKALLRAACELFRFGLNDDDAWDLLLWFNENKSDPQWTERELRHTLGNAKKKVGTRFGIRLVQRNEPKPARTKLRSDKPTTQTPAAPDAPQPPAPAPVGKPIILGTDEHRVIAETLEALAANDHGLYCRGGVLVHVVADSERDKAIRRDVGTPTIRIVPAAHLRERLTSAATFHKINAEDEPKPAHPPAWLVSGIDQRGDYPQIRPLASIADHPILRHDGTIAQTPGYDEATGVLYISPAGSQFAPIADDINEDDAESAALALLDPFCDFPFEADEHRAAFLASILTCVGRHAFDGPAPLFLIDANTRGSGKTILAGMPAEISTGGAASVASYSHDSAEMRKVITASAIAGDRIICLDNIADVLGNDALDRALTATRWRDRVLGRSEMVDLPLSAVWFATANNCQVNGDTTRRIIHVRLDAMTEKPEERSGFKYPNLLAHVRKHRNDLLRSALTILAAYIRRGKPSQNLTPFGSFEGWSDVVRSAVVWSGLKDPCLTRAALVAASDTVADSLAGLVMAWEDYDHMGRGIVVTELLRDLYSGVVVDDGTPKASMRNAVEAIVGCPPGRMPTPRQLGNRFKSYRRRVVAGHYFEIDKDRNHKLGSVWRLIKAA